MANHINPSLLIEEPQSVADATPLAPLSLEMFWTVCSYLSDEELLILKAVSRKIKQALGEDFSKDVCKNRFQYLGNEGPSSWEKVFRSSVLFRRAQRNGRPLSAAYHDASTLESMTYEAEQTTTYDSLKLAWYSEQQKSINVLDIRTNKPKKYGVSKSGPRTLRIFQNVLAYVSDR
ncbi:MAG: hypothetical protein Q9227_007098 [Pyrenula ochraceoflavens]